MWEYCVINLSCLPKKATEADLLNDAGAQGWELVTIIPNLNVAYMKRAVHDESAPAPSPSKRRKTDKP